MSTNYSIDIDQEDGSLTLVAIVYTWIYTYSFGLGMFYEGCMGPTGQPELIIDTNFLEININTTSYLPFLLLKHDSYIETSLFE